MADQHKECSICNEDVPLNLFEGVTTATCTHPREVCDHCIQRHIGHEVNGKGNAIKLKCPQKGCTAELGHGDVQRFATANDFERFDGLLLRQLLQTDPGFRWCVRPGCGSGQIVEDGDENPIMRCAHCNTRSCFKHRVEWHYDLTCDQYDVEQARSEEASLVAVLEQTTKICPQCHEGIEKKEGCDHMTCLCGHEFCYRCGAPYRGPKGIATPGNGNHMHEPTCTYYAAYAE